MMDTITFDRLLLKTAFCCMAADGKIENNEVSIDLPPEKCTNNKLVFSYSQALAT